MIYLDSVHLLNPPPVIVSREWLPDHVSMPEGTETGGLPFSLAAFPHADGVLDAFDNPSIRRIILQWGTRLGKTTNCLSLMAQQARTNPRNMMFSSSTEGAAKRVVGERLWPILAATDGLRLPPSARRSNECIRLPGCRIYVGWSGSAASLADVGAVFGVANEIDKWDSTLSDEADPLKLFCNRVKGFPDHKLILESTPTIRHRSRIESLLHESNQHLRHVPCPHCGEFQVLVKGHKDTPGGFKWWHDGDGHTDPEIAYETAYYQCAICENRIENHHRTEMLRKGIWCPLSCKVAQDGTISGENEKAKSDTIGFGPLPSWYALTQTWGDFPRVWLSAQGKPRELQDVVNSYLAETWEKRVSKWEPGVVGKRLATELPRGVVPEWGMFLTVTVDRQEAEGGFCLWAVLAHGADGQAHLVDDGWGRTLGELWDAVFRRHYAHADGGDAMMPVAGAVDAGWDTKNSYDFCNSHPGLLACKGAGDLAGKPYRLGNVGDASDNHGQLLFHVNTDYWETDLQSRLDERLPGEPGSLSLYDGAQRDPLLLDQLCNAMLTDKRDRRGNQKQLWVKRHTGMPNDKRDVVKYGLALAAAWIEEQGAWPTRATAASRKASGPIVNPGENRRDGRSWT